MNPRNLMILSDVQTVYLCVRLSTCLVFLAVHPSIQHPSIYACPCKNLQQDPHDENCQCPVVLFDPLGAVPMQKPQLVNGTIRPLLCRPPWFSCNPVRRFPSKIDVERDAGFIFNVGLSTNLYCFTMI